MSGTSATRQQPFLPLEEVQAWRNSLGGIENWSPFFTSGQRELDLFGRLGPPLDRAREQFIFCPQIVGPTILGGPFCLRYATVRGQAITLHRGWTATTPAYLLGTDSRLVAYNNKSQLAAQVFYDEIRSLAVNDKHIILGLADGGAVNLQLKVSGPGILDVIDVIGSETAWEKEMYLSRLKGKSADAHTSIMLFARFFAEIIDRNCYS